MRNSYRHLLFIFLASIFFNYIFVFQAFAQQADTISQGDNTAKTAEVVANQDSSAAAATTKNIAVLSPKEFIFGTIQFLCMALIVYFLMVVNPSKTKEEEHRQFLDNLKKNDEVITSTGLYAKVISISPEQIGLEISPNVKVRFDPKHIHPLPKQASNAN